MHKPQGTQRVDRPAIRWVDSAEEDLKIIGIRNCRRRSQDRGQWGAIVSRTVAPAEEEAHTLQSAPYKPFCLLRLQLKYVQG
jgi:hypothetical protein